MADTLVEGSANATTEFARHQWGPYWSDDNNGVIIYVNGSNDLAARRTTNGGTSWDTEVSHAFTGECYISCWFDKQTPGYSDDKVHICAISLGATDDLNYINFDISANAFSTPVQIVTGLTAGTIYYTYIVKRRDGGCLLGHVASGSTSTCYRSNDFASFSSCSNPFESNAADQIRAFVGNTGDNKDCGVVFIDISANAWSIKMFDDSANTFNTETAGGTIVDLTTSNAWDLTMRLSDGHVLFTFQNSTDNAGDDQEAWDIDPTTISAVSHTAKTNVLTNSAETGGACIFVDPNASDAVYACYFRGSAFTATVKAFYKKSTDGMATWGTETALSEDAEDDLRSFGPTALGASGTNGRFQPVWFNDDLNDLYINLNTDIASTGGATVSITGVAATADADAVVGSVATINTVAVAGEITTAAADAAVGAVTAQITVSVAGEIATVAADAAIGSVTAQIAITVAGEIATATADAAVGAVTAIATASVAGEIATAAADALVGAVGIGALVAGEVATADADATIGSVASIAIVSVAGEIATANADALVGSVVAGFVSNIAGEVATADADAAIGTVTAIATASIAGVVATAAADAATGTIAAQVTVTIGGEVTTAIADAVSGTVTALVTATVAGEVATADADAVAGAVSLVVIGSITVAGGVATATADAAVGTIVHLVYVLLDARYQPTVALLGQSDATVSLAGMYAPTVTLEGGYEPEVIGSGEYAPIILLGA